MARNPFRKHSQQRVQDDATDAEFDELFEAAEPSTEELEVPTPTEPVAQPQPAPVSYTHLTLPTTPYV